MKKSPLSENTGRIKNDSSVMLKAAAASRDEAASEEAANEAASTHAATVVTAAGTRAIKFLERSRAKTVVARQSEDAPTVRNTETDSRQKRSRVPLADQPLIDPTSEPRLFLLQQKLKKKAATRAAANVGDIVVAHDPNASLQDQVVAPTGTCQVMERKISNYQAQQEEDFRESTRLRSQLTDFKRRCATFESQNDTLSEQFHEVCATNEQLKTEVAAAADELVKVKDDASNKISELSAAKQEARAKYGEQEILVQKLKTEGRHVVSTNEALEKQVRDLEAEISRLSAGTSDQQETFRAANMDNTTSQAPAGPTTSLHESVVEPAASAATGLEEPLFRKEEEEEEVD